MTKLICVKVVIAAFCAAASVAGPAQGQSVEGMEVGKHILYLQTSATDVVVNPTPVGPTFGGAYGFYAEVDGIGLDAIPAPTVSGPISLAEPAHNGGVLEFNVGRSEWRYGAPDFDVVAVETSAELESLFANGTYTFSNVQGVSASVDLTGDAYPNVPVMTLTGGTWIGGLYSIDPSQPLTITTSAFTAYGSNPGDLMMLELFGDVDFEAEQFSLEVADPNFLSIAVPADTLTEGETYGVRAEWLSFVDLKPVAGLPDATALAGYGVETFLTVQATPEPTSLALAALGGMVLLRRKRRL